MQQIPSKIINDGIENYAAGNEDRFKLVIEGRFRSCVGNRNQTILQALTAAGIFLEANCGGRGTCGKCKIHVLQGKVHSYDVDLPVHETDQLYLACQIYPAEDMSLRLKVAGVSAKGNITRLFEDDGRPLLQKIVLTTTYPTLENNYSLQEMIGQAMKGTAIMPENGKILRELAKVAGRSSGPVTAVLFGAEIIAVESGDTTDRLFGVAFDIGTTTVVGMLVNINGQRILTTYSETNPQVVFGADVISRIDAAAAPEVLTAEAQAIRQCLDRIITELCALADISPENIYAITIAGNSTMEHLLMQIAPQSLAVKPYVSVFRHISPINPTEIGLKINHYGKVVLLPNIASFIGADTTAAILATSQDISGHQSLLIDLGTNAEIVLGNREKLLACSTAAGPAFEGAHIRDGMRASSGAIVDVSIDDDVVVKTIAGDRAAGICGSGIVKAIAELVKLENYYRQWPY